MPILVGLDGVRKMSKSSGNYVAIDDPPNEMFGKLMSIPDELIGSYARLVSDTSISRLAEIENALSSGKVNPMTIKKEVAGNIVDLYHGAGSGKSAQLEFERVFSKGHLPENMPELDCSKYGEGKIAVLEAMTTGGIVASKSEARRLINSGAVSIDETKVSDVNHEIRLSGSQVIRVGKRRFLKLVFEKQ
ncbi:MAG: tyrosine--tRNA ligase, partial [candidate division Zixibacteria bacterium]|nr:tyrosine--tRNA ligase [candidate division Zixibacteria bacterium]